MYDYKATVTRVVDGDTVEADLDLGFDETRHLRFRLADVNCPDLHEGDRAKGRAAKDYTTAALLGRSVVIRSRKVGDPVKAEKYGRWLATVELADGTVFNEAIVRDGHAVPFMVGE